MYHLQVFEGRSECRSVDYFDNQFECIGPVSGLLARFCGIKLGHRTAQERSVKVLKWAYSTASGCSILFSTDANGLVVYTRFHCVFLVELMITLRSRHCDLDLHGNLF